MNTAIAKLEEMDRAGVVLLVYSPSFFSYNKKWEIQAKKTEGGVKLEIDVLADSFAEAVEEIYTKWLSSTRGLPEHGLLVISHQPTVADQQASKQASKQQEVDWKEELNDEIPF